MSLKKLQKFTESDNIALMLSDAKLRDISAEVLMGFEEDKKSVQEWMDYAKRSLELTQLKREVKHTPMRNASNVKYPLVTTAVVQFSARTLPELIKSGEVAKYRIIGKDPTGTKNRLGIRLKTHLNYQIMELMPNWLDERDRLLMHLGVVGTAYTKTWYDPITGSPRSELIPYDEIIVNDGIKSLDEAERISHIITYSMNEIVEHIRFGLFKEIDDEHYSTDSTDSINPQELIEQHCLLDLDDDGYREPYIVTVHHASGEVMRIVARYTMDSVVADAKGTVLKIFGQKFFNDYHFIPNPAGTFHSIGFGTLLLDMNESVNTILNQLIDAGKLANLQGGFIGTGLRLRSKTIDLEPGEWLAMESANGDSLRNNIVPLNYKEPSLVLFQLLGLLIESAQNLTSTTEALTGNAEAQNTSPNTILALIQQGLKVFTSIQRRIFRGFKKELSKIVELNRLYLDPQEYLQIIDPSEEELMEMIDAESGMILDYINAGVDVVPVADINTSTEAEQLVRAQSELNAGLQLAPTGAVDIRAIARNYFKSLESPNIEELVPPPPPPQPSPDMIKIQSEIDKTARELEFKQAELNIKALEMEAKIKEIASKAVKNIADAEAAEAGTQLAQYKSFFDTLMQEMSLKLDQERQRQEDGRSKASDAPGAASTMDGAPNDASSV